MKSGGSPLRPVALAKRFGQAPCGVADQGLISASNLCMTVLLARSLTQDAFGIFAMSFTGLLFANSLQNGLVTQPHNIVGPTLSGAAYRRYTTSVALSQGALSLVMAAAVLMIAAASAAIGWHDASALLLVLAPTVLMWQGQEFIRCVLYTEGRVGRAFAHDLVAYGGQAVGIAGLWWVGELTAARAIIIMLITHGSAMTLGLWPLRHSLSMDARWSDVQGNLRVGKWLAGREMVGTWLCDNMLIYVAAAVVGPAAAGILRGVNTLLGPVRVLIQAVNIMLPIRLARTLATDGDAALRLQLRRAATLVIPVFAGFCLVLMIFAEPVLRLAYGDAWGAEAGVLQLFAMVSLVLYIAETLSAALKAKQATRTMFANRLISSIVGLSAGCTLVFVLGLYGAILGMFAGGLTQAWLNYRAYQRLTMSSADPDAPAAMVAREAVA